MNKTEKECLISKLNVINIEINREESLLLDISKRKKDKNLEQWCEIELRLLRNLKIMIEQSLINDFIEDL